MQGVVAGHDLAQRRLLNELRKMTRARPATPEEAFLRWGGLAEWAEAQDRPATSDQHFDD